VRRRILLALGLFVTALAFPSAAMAQTPKRKLPTVGYLAPGAAIGGQPTAHPTVEGFRQGLRELGYVEGRTILIEYRFAEGKFERLPELAAELVRLKVNVIVTGAGPASLRAARDATTTIPIVMAAAAADPVQQGFVASLSRPGGNITGLTTASTELVGKRLELLKEALPGLARVAILWDASAGRLVGNELRQAAQSLGLELLPHEVRSPDDFSAAVESASKQRAGAVLVASTPLFSGPRRAQLIELLIRYRLPAVSSWRDFAEAGGLMAYGPVGLHEQFRRAAAYVDKILKGAKPGELPVEQPTKFELVVNLKTANALGLTIPPALLLRADEVIR
jgi:putative ABC transport system substrate-binding protein